MPVRPVVTLVALCALFALSVGAGSAHLLFSMAQSNRAPVRATPGPASNAQPLDLKTPVVASAIQAPTSPPTVQTIFTVTPTSKPTNTPTVMPSATQPPTATSASTSTPTSTHTPIPRQMLLTERTGGPVTVPNKHKGVRWVTLQAGHYHNDVLPEELKHLTDHTGASAGGVNEVDVNVAVANLTAQMLYARGYSVDLLGATVPVSYTTDLFLALHADGNTDTSLRGFKAVAPWGSVPASDTFVGLLYEEYGKATRLPSDPRTSEAMANYYAFNPIKYLHAVNTQVSSALLEMGFVTNALDREVLAREEDRIALGIANAVDRYFRSGAAGPTPSPYPTFTPTRTPTPTSTPSPTATLTPSVTPSGSPTPGTPDPMKDWALTQTAIERIPTSTHVPTPITGTITTDGRWLPPVAPNGHNLPPPGSDAPPVLLGEANDDLGPDYVATVPGWQPHVWLQYYVPRLGRSIWQMGPLFVATPTATVTSTPTTSVTPTLIPTSTPGSQPPG